jgi:NAD(P)-dependent dehydrogenase (short-subunit alcohol dehydrogenase family)
VVSNQPNVVALQDCSRSDNVTHRKPWPEVCVKLADDCRSPATLLRADRPRLRSCFRSWADIDEAAASRVGQELANDFGSDAFGLRTDVASKADDAAMVQACKDTRGTLHILVNNAWGGETLCRVGEKPDAQLAHGFNVAFYEPF